MKPKGEIMAEESLLRLMHTLRAKCMDNDCSIYQEMNLSPGEYNFILAAMEFDKPECTPIQKKMGISASRFSRILDKMVKNGYVDRVADQKDRRANNIAFTETGKKLLAEIEDKLQVCESQIAKDLTHDQMETIKNSFELVLKNFEKSKL